MSAAYAKRFEAVFLCKHTKGPKMSREAAARSMKKSKSFVSKWIKRYETTNTVDDLPGRGKVKKILKEEDEQIIQLFSTNPRLSLRQGQAILKKRGINLSVESIRTRLRVSNLKHRIKKPLFLKKHVRISNLKHRMKKPLLSEKHVARRIAWARENINRDWKNVIFSYKSSFWVQNTSNRASSTFMNKLLQRAVSHPVKVNVWGCISSQGFGTLSLFTENLDAKNMVKIYQRALIPSAEKWFQSKSQDWIFQEDDNPKYRSHLCCQWKEENNIKTLDWPSQSPNLNPIENVWRLIKTKLHEKKVYTVKQLTRQIRSIWRSLPREYAATLVESMPQRCQAIIDSGGDWTTY